MNQNSQTSLSEYLNTPIKLFIADQAVLGQAMQALTKLGFAKLTVCRVKTNHFQAIQQLYGEIIGFEGLVLVNHPPQAMKDSAGLAYQDMRFADFYQGVASLNKSTRKSASDFLQKCVPILTSAQDSDIRQRIIEDLFPYGIMAVFLLGVLPLGMSKADQLEERMQELHDYLVEFFLSKERKLKEFKEYKSAEELRDRRARAEELMAEAERLKMAKEYDKAIALCRDAIETLPTDPGAYLEGGKLLVKKRKYPPAMQMFRDAEAVAEELPGPNQEIGNLRVAQIKDYVSDCRSSGEPVDQETVNGYLQEALENYQESIAKTDKIKTLRANRQESMQKTAIVDVMDNILTAELAEVLGRNNPLLHQMSELVQTTLREKVGEGGEIPAGYMVQYGLMAFHDGDFDAAEKYLFQAAKNPETKEDACTKINYLGTQYRQRGQNERAIEAYKRLLTLRPSFKGSVLFNLAVAQAARLSEQDGSAGDQALKLRQEAMGTVVEAFYIDPSLNRDKNFYANTVIAPILHEAMAILKRALHLPPPENEDAAMRACRQAGEKMECLLEERKDMEALRYMFGLTQSLRQFFLNFDQYATPKVLSFACRLHPVLANHQKPKMKTFGKILEVLVAKGEKACRLIGEEVPELRPTMRALNQADQAGAARELVKALAENHMLVRDMSLKGDTTLLNLTKEVLTKLSGIDFALFEDARSGA